MTTANLKAIYGLKFNPFAQSVPTSALLQTPTIEDFAWRIEQGIAQDGGFALITGEHGTGKSTALRLLAAHLARLRDVQVALIERPQSGVPDFYREMGELFGIPLSPHNRWAGFRALRERWIAHIDASMTRPLLLIDEAQEMNPAVLCELRLLTQSRFDSNTILGVVLAGDRRVLELLQRPELLPLNSRLRARVALTAASPEDLRHSLVHRMTAAGNASLLAAPVIDALCEHALGCQRTMFQMADELLARAARLQADIVDEKLYFETFPPPGLKTHKNKSRRATSRKCR